MKKELSKEQKIERFNDILSDSEYVIFLGGAGVSTESGISEARMVFIIRQRSAFLNTNLSIC